MSDGEFSGLYVFPFETIALVVLSALLVGAAPVGLFLGSPVLTAVFTVVGGFGLYLSSTAVKRYEEMV